MTIERLPSFLYFRFGFGSEAVEILSWHEAAAYAAREGYTAILGVTWDATQLLTLAGEPCGRAVSCETPVAPQL